MYLANKPHDLQKLFETSFQVVLDSHEVIAVPGESSRFCKIRAPKPTREPR